VTPPARVLVRLPNWLGDIVMAVPAVAALRRHFERSTLVGAAPEAFASLVGAVPGVDEVVPLAAATGWARVRHDAGAIAAARADLVVLLTNSFGSALAARRAGVPERWGYARDGRRWLLTRAIPRRHRGTHPGPHHSRYYLRLLDGLGIDASPEPVQIDVPAAWRQRAADLLATRGVGPGRPIVGLAPGAAYGGAKRWPPAHVARLVVALAERSDATAVLVGAGGDRGTGHEIESKIREASRRVEADGRLVNLIGATDLPTLAGIAARAAAFVSNDSGAMHLAAAVGTHVVALFGPTDEQATSPLGPHTILVRDVFCRPCLLRECPIDHRCMKRITPDAVLDALWCHLAGGRVRPEGESL
jgi:heptosyltransferase-2